MSNKVNMIGKRFGKLIVISEAGSNSRGDALWLCKCDCGNEKIVRGSHLRYGNIKSCGCLNNPNLIGQRFGNLIVIRKFGNNKYNHVLWSCKCDCGNETIVSSSGLLGGSTKSCGCLAKPHGMFGTRFYKIYQGIKQRCNNKKDHAYHLYGGRGITICDRWKNFINFKEDMYESYLDHCKEFGEKQTTIDRVDVNGNYCKDNCRWATYKEQANNKTTNHIICVNGENMTVTQVSEKYGINYQTILHRLNRGECIFGSDKSKTI